MQWTLDTLIAAERAGQRLKFVFFWGHTPGRAGEVGPHVLSQWFEHDFELDGVPYPSAEHFMMAEKARLFEDQESLASILSASSPGAAKALGRGVSGFNHDRWVEHRLDIVTRGSIAKFDSSDELRNYLVGTGDRVLVEASPVDPIWGVGLTHDDPAAIRPSRWKGENLLGFALMGARAALVSGHP